MKRWLIGAAVLGVVYYVARSMQRSRSSPWEAILERRPDSAPPKWMFNNITAIREDTDRILERLDAALTR